MKEREIPPTSRVSDEIKNVLQRRFKVESQEELAALVLRKIKKENKMFSLSPIRAKRIALTIPEIEVKAKTKKNHTLVSISACPVCESAISPIEVRNLANKKIVIGWKCSKCKYESDLEAFVPMKYSFVYKP
jgi:ribosomal protein L37AE/L43A